MTTRKAALILVVSVLNARAADPNSEAAMLGAVPAGVQAPATQLVLPLLEAVCPGHVIPSRANPGCSNWGDAPPGVAPPRSVSGVLLGHFLSAETDDALVSAERGETHPDRYGGALFLTRQAGVWKPLWYSSGTITDHCMKVRSASGRDVPVCESAYIMGGHRTHDLYALTILPTGPVEQILLSTDTFAWPNRLQKETLDSVKPLSRDGSTMVEVRVHYFRSDNPGGSDLSDPDKIAGEPHIIDFHLEGTKFVVTPASAGFLSTFSLPPN